MSTLAHVAPADAPRWPALIPPLLIGIPVALKLAGVSIANPWIIFALLFGLMLTGMPISISLGLTVLTYLFTMTTVPIESVALKLFTGIVGTLGATFVWENGAHHAIFHALGIATDTPEGPTTPDLETPTWIVYSAVPLGSYLMCFRFLQVTLGFLRTGELPHHDQSKVEGIDEPGLPPGEEDKIYRMDDELHPRDKGEPR